MSEKNYIKWSARERVFDNGWSIIRLSLYLPDLLRLPMTEKWYISVQVWKKKEVDEYDNTHYVYEDDYDPKWYRSKNQKTIALADEMEWKKIGVEDDLPREEPKKKKDLDEDDLPF